MQVVLVMFNANGAKRSFALTRQVTVIGRREDCDLRIPLTEVSRKHCRLVKDGSAVRIEDLGSSNGTFYNGARVQESLLQPGDTVKVGPVLFTVQIDGFPSDEMITMPPEAETESSSVGAQIDQPDSSSSATVDSPRAKSALSSRPATPQGDDFAITTDEDADDDVIDMNTIISPADDDDLMK